MTEKEMFMNNWQREFGTTLKILKQMPADKAGFKPVGEKTRTAKEIATVFIQELGVVDGVVKGKIDFGGAAPSFPTYGDVVKAYEGKHKEMVAKVQGMSEADWNSKLSAPVGPKQMADVRRAQDDFGQQAGERACFEAGRPPLAVDRGAGNPAAPAVEIDDDVARPAVGLDPGGHQLGRQGRRQAAEGGQRPARIAAQEGVTAGHRPNCATPRRRIRR